MKYKTLDFWRKIAFLALMVTLLDLPYDVLLSVACCLELRDIHALQLVSVFICL